MSIPVPLYGPPASQPGREAYIREHLPTVGTYLLDGDGFRPLLRGPRRPLGLAWRDILDHLVAAGYMRRSRSRHYWWREVAA